MRQSLTTKTAIIILLIVQVIPFLLFPISSYTVKSQEWWLPVLLCIFAAIGVFEIVVRRVTALWPWYLVSFGQGFNIISRLMMLFPHATYNTGSADVFNTSYFTLSLVSMLISAFYLWYAELPEVRLRLLKS